MKYKASLYWIVLLLAALFLGPWFFQNPDRVHPRTRKAFGPLEPEQRIVDAPAGKTVSSPIQSNFPAAAAPTVAR